LELSEYELELLREDQEFILYRGHARRAAAASVLLLAPSSTHSAPESLQKIEHEYSFRSELDSTWAVRPIALSFGIAFAPYAGMAVPRASRIHRLQNGDEE